VRTLDVGVPGVDESTTVFPGDLGGMSGAQTTLQYGSFGPAGPIAEPDYLGMAVLRAYVGYKVQGAPRFTVSHVGGRVRLTWRFPGFSAAVLKRLGAPSSVVKKFRQAARQGQIVMTILGTTSRRQAQAKRLFAIDNRDEHTAHQRTSADRRHHPQGTDHPQPRTRYHPRASRSDGRSTATGLTLSSTNSTEISVWLPVGAVQSSVMTQIAPGSTLRSTVVRCAWMVKAPSFL
jgi:hypothetical protein